MTDVALSFLVTYAIHSSILLLSAAGLNRIANLSASVSEVLWKVVLVGGVISSVLSLSGSPRVTPMDFPITASIAPSEPTIGSLPTVQETRPLPTLSAQPADDRDSVTNRPISIQSIVLTAWIGGAVLFVLHLIVQHGRLMVALRSRRRIADGELPGYLALLGRSAGFRHPIRLSVDPDCPTPLALGLSEICVPERFLRDLDAAEQQAALAHELAHLVRRDPLWNILAGLIEALFFFQPLNRLATAQIRSVAELRSDEWAARQVGSGTDVARGLTSIASWVNDSRIAARAVVAMAEGGALLSYRVECLLRGPTAKEHAVAPTAVASVALVAVVTAAAPAVKPVHMEATAGLVEANHSTASANPTETPDIRVKVINPETDGSEGGMAHWTWQGILAYGAVEIKAPVGDVEFSRGGGAEVEIIAAARGKEYGDLRFEVVEHQGGITVCAIFPPTPGMPENFCEPGHWRIHSSKTNARADFQVKLPAGIDAIARSMTGDVRVWSPPANVLVQNGTGHVSLFLEEPGWQGWADLTNESGNITIRTNRDAGVWVDAASANGRVDTEFPILDRIGPQRGTDSIEGHLGDAVAGGFVRARTEWGNIEFQAR